jgi:hypothetical protein
MGGLGRLLARFGIGAVVCAFVALVTVQYGRIIQRNIAYAQNLRDVDADITALQIKHDQQMREIRRLSDPRGAIPEIHDRLRLVGDHEAIIYLRRHDAAPVSSPAPAPDPDAGL